MEVFNLNDKYIKLILKNVINQEEVDVTPDFGVASGETYVTLSESGPTSETYNTNSGVIVHKTGNQSQTMGITVPQVSRAAETFRRWQREATAPTGSDTQLRATLAFPIPTEDNRIETRVFEGSFKNTPAESYGGSIHKQTWEVIVKEVA